MGKLYLLLVISFLSYVTSNSIGYNSISADSYSNSNSKSDQIESDGDEYNSYFDDISQRISKRDTESGEWLSLSDIIENIEDSLLDSALGASNIHGILTSDNGFKRYTDENFSDEKDLSHIVEKRQDGKENDKSKSSDEKSSTSSSNEKSDSNESETVLTHFKAREVPISDDHAAHVAVDRVTVFVANQGFLPMIPSFDFHHSGVQHESIKEILEDSQNSNSSEEKDIKESTTDSTVDVTTTVSTETITKITTPKKTAEELKEAEEELKEKVAEVEAEPIILSARV